MKKIDTREIKNCEITVPGSKSYTHRLLIASSLSDGLCRVSNILKSEDTILTMESLKLMGIDISAKGTDVEIKGTSGILNPYEDLIYLANSGTSIRLLTGVAAIGNGSYTLTGTERMQERPIQHLLNGLSELGVDAYSINDTGCPPIKITGKKIDGGEINLDCSLSSQFLSSILLIAPYTKKGVKITISGELVSKPYVDMTIDIMMKLGVEVERDGYFSFSVKGNQNYVAGEYAVEPDCSNSSYFWAAAAITGKTVKVKNISKDSRQGDVKFVEVLEKMGCKISYEDDGISVTGSKLNGIEVDMSNMPDVVPTLAVVASFAKGTTYIKNVAHLKEKECDRITSVVTELTKMGVDIKATESGMIISGGNKPHGAIINTYNDHRMAMCFSVAGILVPDLYIEDESCVVKSFPDYWDVFEKLF